MTIKDQPLHKWLDEQAELYESTESPALIETSRDETYTVHGTRCFPEGATYSDPDCVQEFDTFEEADQHRIERHAAPRGAWVQKTVTTVVTRETP